MINQQLALEVKENGTTTLTDRRTGKSWRCAPPIVRLWNVAEDRLAELSADRLSVSRIDGNSNVTLSILAKDKGISFDIEYSLKESVMEVRIPISSIEEKDPGFRLLSVTPLPSFGAVSTGEPGYILLPNYSGVICRFDKDVSLTHSDMVYMQQSQWEDFADLPVFGICHKDSAFLGVLVSGEFDAEVVTELNSGTNRQNCIYPRLHYRYGKADSIDNIDRIIRYNFLSGDDASYAGMACAYRNYLLQERHLRPLKDRLANQKPLSNYNAYNFIKIFCAAKSPQPDGAGAMHITTTFAQAQEILKELKDAGIERASIILVGWNQEGHDGKYPTRLPADPRLGGDEGLKRLIDYAKGLGYQITFHDNYADGYQTSPDFDEGDAVMDRDGWPTRAGTWSGGRSYILCPHKSLKFAERDLVLTRGLGLNGLCYLDAMIQPPRICYDKRHGHPATRRAYCEGAKAIARLGREIFGGCEIENAVDFISDSIDGIAQVITHKVSAIQDSNLGRYFIDEFVPFYQIAYHGIIQYRICPLEQHEQVFGSTQAGLLKEIEYGAMPRTEVCYEPQDECEFPCYRESLPLMKKQYDILCKELGHLQLEFVEDHRMLSPGAYRTLYSGGTEVIVNYGEIDYVYNGRTVKSKSYLVTEGREL